MGFKEWKYNRLKRRIAKDKKLCGFIGNRIQKTRRKMTKIENDEDMLIFT